MYLLINLFLIIIDNEKKNESSQSYLSKKYNT